MKTLKFEINKEINKEIDIVEKNDKELGFSSQSSENFCKGRISAFQTVLGLIEDGAVVE